MLTAMPSTITHHLIKRAGCALLGITGHKHLACVAGLHTHGLAERWLAGREIAARCTATEVTTGRVEIATGCWLEITTGREVATGRTCITAWSALATSKAVVETTLAFVAEAFFGRATEVTCAVAKVTRASSGWASTEAAATVSTAIAAKTAAIATKATFTGAIAELAVTAEAATWVGTTRKTGA